MHHLRGIMKQSSKSMSAKITDDTVTMPLGMPLDRVGYIAHMISRSCLLDPQHQALIGDLDQSARAQRYIPDQVHPAAITVPPVKNWRDIDIDDVSAFQRLLTRNAVANDMVDRDAAGMGVATIAQGRRNTAARLNECVDQPIYLAGRDTGHHMRHQHVQCFRRQSSRGMHTGEGAGAMQLYGAGACLGGVSRIFGHEG